MRLHDLDPSISRMSLRSVLFACALGLSSVAAWASPDETSDPVHRLLKERGLLETAPSSSEPSSRGVVSKPLKKASQSASELALSALNFLGVRYQAGGDSIHTGFDCSGFTRHIYKNSLGVTLPRRVDEQASAPGFRSVDRSDLKPGDLVFFNTLGRTFSHVGIYVGQGKFIHAPRSGSHVRIESLGADYWSRLFTGARRATTGNTEVRVDSRGGETPPDVRTEPRGEQRSESNFIQNFIPAYVPVDFSGDTYAR